MCSPDVTHVLARKTVGEACPTETITAAVHSLANTPSFYRASDAGAVLAHFELVADVAVSGPYALVVEKALLSVEPTKNQLLTVDENASPKRALLYEDSLCV